MFPLKSVGDNINSKVIIKKISLDTQEDFESAKKFNFKVIPTYIFFDGEGNEFMRSLGSSATSEGFIGEVDYALNPDNSHTMREKRFKEDPSYDMEYVKYYRNQFEEEMVDSLINNVLFPRRTIEEKFSEEMLGFYIGSTMSLDSEVFKFIFANQKDVANIMGKEKFEVFMKNKAITMLHSYCAFNKDFTKLKDLISTIDKYPVMRSGYTVFVADNIDNLTNGNTNLLCENATKALKKSGSATKEAIIAMMEYMSNKISKEQFINFYEQVIKYEKDNAVRAEYTNRLESIERAAIN